MLDVPSRRSAGPAGGPGCAHPARHRVFPYVLSIVTGGSGAQRGPAGPENRLEAAEASQETFIQHGHV